MHHSIKTLSLFNQIKLIPYLIYAIITGKKVSSTERVTSAAEWDKYMNGERYKSHCKFSIED